MKSKIKELQQRGECKTCEYWRIDKYQESRCIKYSLRNCKDIQNCPQKVRNI